MKELKDNREFEWYKKELDVRRKYNHEHSGKPKEYPCRVISELDNVSDYSSSYGATDIYNHKFIYKATKKCSKCGHITNEWPKGIDEIVEQ